MVVNLATSDQCQASYHYLYISKGPALIANFNEKGKIASLNFLTLELYLLWTPKREKDKCQMRLHLQRKLQPERKPCFTDAVTWKRQTLNLKHCCLQRQQKVQYQWEIGTYGCPHKYISTTPAGHVQWNDHCYTYILQKFSSIATYKQESTFLAHPLFSFFSTQLKPPGLIQHRVKH